MNKTEYVDSISRALSGRVDPQVQRETVQYYREYIDSQIVKGNPEETVLATLGDPHLLAKSVIASQPANAESTVKEESVKKSLEALLQEKKPILILIAVLLVLVLLLGLVFKVLIKLLPILLPAAAVFFVIRAIRNRKR